MSIQTTAAAAAGYEAASTMGDQHDVFETQRLLAKDFPGLPTPFVSVHSHYRLRVDAQLGSPHDFEAWREALGIDPRSVDLRGGIAGTSAWLEVDHEFHGTQLHITGHGVPLYAVASTPELVAQRHEWADPAEPPAYCSARAAAGPAIAPVVTA